jgi:hypothetical protein
MKCQARQFVGRAVLVSYLRHPAPIATVIDVQSAKGTRDLSGHWIWLPNQRTECPAVPPAGASPRFLTSLLGMSPCTLKASAAAT